MADFDAFLAKLKASAEERAKNRPPLTEEERRALLAEAEKYRKEAEIRDEIQDLPVAMDMKGHFRRGFSLPADLVKREIRSSIAVWLFEEDCEEARRLREAVQNGKLDPDNLPTLPTGLTCGDCGEYIRFAYDGMCLRVVNEPCAHPDGILTEFELNVPSGKIVVSDNLGMWFHINEDPSLNRPIGCHKASMAYADVGLASGLVGNTCPTVFKNGDKYVISSDSESRWGEAVAGICTDLWWYSICDYEELERRYAHYTPDEDFGELPFEVVDVRPGVYRFTQRQGIDRHEDGVVLASFEWVRDPDPVRDFLAEDDALEINATEALIESCLSWPTLYMRADYLLYASREEIIAAFRAASDEEKARFMAYAANHFMVTIGTGVSWHRKGFPRLTISAEAKELAKEMGEVPRFEGTHSWYPISAGWGSLCHGAGVTKTKTGKPTRSFSPSFVRLGLNICQNALTYGVRIRDDAEGRREKSMMRVFLKCYKGLRKHYPDIVLDEAFDQKALGKGMMSYIREWRSS